MVSSIAFKELGEPPWRIRCPIPKIRGWLTGRTQFRRGISFAFLIRSIDFRREVRPEFAPCLFELGFSSRHLRPQTVELLGTQQDQSEHKYEQDFTPNTHDSPLTLWSPETVVPLLAGFSSSLIASLKPRMPSPIPLPSSGSFLGPNTSRAIPKITKRCMG